MFSSMFFELANCMPRILWLRMRDVDYDEAAPSDMDDVDDSGQFDDPRDNTFRVTNPSAVTSPEPFLKALGINRKLENVDRNKLASLGYPGKVALLKKQRDDFINFTSQPD